MVSPIPKWVMQRYSMLWNKYHDAQVSYADIQKVLKTDGRNTISVFLKELRSAGWLDITMDEEDLRKRNYVLKDPHKVVKEMET